MTPKPTTIDFESQMIMGRPVYPPVPVGVSIKKHGRPSRYLAWGHLSGNTCRYADAAAALAQAVTCKDGVLFQNAKFDLAVLEEFFPAVAKLAWAQVHDTMFLLYLDDPHQAELGLKPSAERLLGQPPEERDAVANWLMSRQPVPGVRLSKAPKSPYYFMKYLEHCPGTVVGPYANGDTDRTEALFNLLWAKNQARGMEEAYNWERRLLPVLRRMEAHGVRVDLARLRADVAMYDQTLASLDEWLTKKLGRVINLDSAAELVEALVSCKLIADIGKLGITEKGNIKSDKAALAAAVEDPQVAGVLRYRAQLRTCLNTFMKPWLVTAELSDGLIYTTWNQTRGGEGGTRTGRLSSTPNFQNIPKEFSPIWAHEKPGLPVAPLPLPPLPLCRGYVVPMAKGHVLIGRDYSQQEPRILAHFEGGALLAQYQRNPWIDFHDNAKEHLDALTGKDLPRKKVKGINLGIIYGMGLGSMAIHCDSTVDEVKEIRQHIYNLYPGLKTMYTEMRAKARANEPIHTWGGREYFCEPPKIINGRVMSFDYKLVNLQVQGSAADCTKTALVNFYDQASAHRDWFLYFNVHDELVISAPKLDLTLAMATLRQAMESVEFSVPMLSEGAYSELNWAAMKDYDKKGKVLDGV